MQEIFLPPHVWDMIFMYVRNPFRLMKLREVSKFFKEIIEKKIENTNMWKVLCPPWVESWMHTIIKIKYPYRQFLVNDILSDEDYKEHFINYQKWRRVANLIEPKFNVDFQKFFLEGKEVTCVDACGRFIIFGTNLGRVHFSLVTEPEKLVLVHDFKKSVTDIKFWFTDGNIVVVALIEKYLQFWYLNEASEISNSICDMTEHLCIGVANRLFVENQLLIVEYKYENKRVFPSRNCTIPNDNSSNKPKFLSMHNRSDDLTVMTEMNRIITVYEINFPDVSSENIELKKVYAINHNIIYDPERPIISSMPIEETGFYTAENNIIVHSKFPGLERKWSSLKLNIPLKVDNIVNVTMFANIYFICWESGTIDKVSIKKSQNKKDFVIKKLKISLVLEKPTIAINFTEHKDHKYAIFTTKTSAHYLTK
ncbi:uncharacterized protein LOC123260503 [Cotesia glomerata]|uniref:uncharacterized protein LOC123260503 n=1 Tax=Cotesia glomerata TaxID=32391 RepID=UPI001D032E3E|nr:uncharacterized protein LOC123260503 [Cotesia glomerata]